MDKAESALRFILQMVGLAAGVTVAVLSALVETPFETIGMLAGIGLFSLGVAALSGAAR